MRWLVALGLVLSLLNTGCWDARSIDQRAFVVMMGIDALPEGRFRITLQTQRAGFEQQRSGQAGGATPQASQVLSSEGETVREALEKTRDNLAREIDTTFLDVIVLSREVAANHLEDMDYIVRTFRIPVSAFVCVAPAEAEPVVRSRALGFNMPAHFALFSQVSGGWSRSAAMVQGYMWMIFNRTYFTPLEDPFAPVLGSEGGQLSWKGLAVFRGHRLAALLKEQDAATFNLLLGARAERIVAADVPGFSGARATAYLQRAHVNRKVTWEGDRPVIQVRVSARGTLQELMRMRMDSEAAETAVEAALSRALAREVREFVGRLQAVKSDPIGFGEMARQAAPYRAEVQRGEAWHDAYQQARLDVSAHVTVEAPGYMK